MKNKAIISLLIIGLIAAPFVRKYLLKGNKDLAKAELDRTTLIVGTNAEYPPFTYVEDEKYIGFDIDVVKEVAARMKKTIQIIDMPFESIIPAALLGRVHVVAAGLTETPLRAKKVLFSKCYYMGDRLQIVSKKSNNNEINSLTDLKDKKVIVNEGYTADMYISSKERDFKIIRLNAPADGFMALNSKRADAFVTSQCTVESFFETNSIGNVDEYQIATINDETAVDHYSLAISPKYAHLLDEINEIITQLLEEGKIEALKKKWKI